MIVTDSTSGGGDGARWNHGASSGALAKARIDARRAIHFVGGNAKYAELKDLFLTMEGVAQWVSYRWLTHPRGGANGSIRSVVLGASFVLYQY